MVSWNPNSPLVVGLEQPLAGVIGPALTDSAAAQHLIRFRALNSAVLDHVWLWSGPGTFVPIIATPPPLILELLPRASEAAATAASFNSDVATHIAFQTSGWTDAAGGSLTDGDLPTGMKTTGSGNPAINLQFPTSAFTLARHVIDVGVSVDVSASAPGALLVITLDAAGGGAPGNLQCQVPIPVGGTGRISYRFGELLELGSGRTLLTAQQIRAFASGATYTVRLQVFLPAATGPIVGIGYVALEEYWITERRLAVGIAPLAPFVSTNPPPFAAGAWTDWHLSVPGGTGVINTVTSSNGSFSTVSGTDYSLLVRRARGPSFVPQYGVLSSGQDPHQDPVAVTAAFRRLRGAPVIANRSMVPVASVDPVTLQPAAVGAAVAGMPPVRFRTSTADRSETQPYVAPGALAAYAGSNVIQRFFASTASTYTLLAIDLSADWAPTQPLTLVIEADGGGFHYTQTATVTVAQLAASGVPVGNVPSGRSTDNTQISARVRRIVVDFAALGASSGLINGTAYQVTIVSATPASNPWIVHGFFVDYGDTDSGTSAGDAAGAWYDSGVTVSGGSTKGDVNLTVTSPPAAPSGLAGALSSQAVTAGGLCGSLHSIPQGIPYAHLTWTATAMGAAFAAYIVERSDPLTTIGGVVGGWQPIAYITAEASNLFDDYEGRLGVTSSYRVRVVRLVDLAPSNPSGTVTVTPAPVGCALTFTSNESPASNLAYPETFDGAPVAERGFTYPEAGETQLRTFYGRDHQFGFNPTERRGTTMTRPVRLNALCAASPAGPRQFSALRTFAHAALSYVCVRGKDGERYFATLTVPDAKIIEPSDTYEATVTIAEAATVPSLPDVR